MRIYETKVSDQLEWLEESEMDAKRISAKHVNIKDGKGIKLTISQSYRQNPRRWLQVVQVVSWRA
ncbi:hypothetical protein ACQKL5_15950 [Peribacillus sp. NPDC097675]|uniref:hypothetical protein n=1 Tax=Peribacillus sp. NPDC097675 TaxID=3390618 RepID=UPI003D01181C